MKKLISFKRILVHTSCVAMVLIGLSSCVDNKTEDTKEVAEDRNDAKFNDSKSEKDAQFLVNASELNQEQIDLGKLAQQSSKREDVRALGQSVENAHVKSMKELAGLALSKSVTLPASATNDSRDAYATMSKKAGVEFDKEYCDLMVKSHKDAITLFENESTEGTDNDIRQWASGMLPGLRAHLDKALICQKNVDKL